jgi:hypothetical protein
MDAAHCGFRDRSRVAGLAESSAVDHGNNDPARAPTAHRQGMDLAPGLAALGSAIRDSCTRQRLHVCTTHWGRGRKRGPKGSTSPPAILYGGVGTRRKRTYFRLDWKHWLSGAQFPTIHASLWQISPAALSTSGSNELFSSYHGLDPVFIWYAWCELGRTTTAQLLAILKEQSDVEAVALSRIQTIRRRGRTYDAL